MVIYNMDGNGEKVTLEKSPLKNDQPEVDSLSLSMSLSLPMPDDNKNDKTEEISEHLSTNSGSFENDRSFQEIEVLNDQNLEQDGVDPIYNETPCVLDCSIHSENSIISLNYLKNLEDSYVRNILEDIFQPDRDKDLTVSSKEESFNIFANLDLDDKSLLNLKHSTDASLNNGRPDTEFSLEEKNLYATNFGLPSNDELSKRIKDFEEIIALKDCTIAALTSELDSIKEHSNFNTGSTLSTTEYKQLQDEWHGKFVEYNREIVYKDELIQQLTVSLDQSVKERKIMLAQIDELKIEIVEMQSKLNNVEDETKEVELDVPDKKGDEIEEPPSFPEKVNENFAKEYSTLHKTLDIQQQHLLIELNSKFNDILENTISKCRELYESEIKTLKDNTATEKVDFECEISRLKKLIGDFKSGSTQLMDFKKDLQIKHSQEMEELRTYFEQKCTELEKNYSEEIFSHHSRKMSSSSCSEAELNSFSQTPGPEGDGLREIQSNLSKKDVINLQNELNSIINKISKCDLDTMNDDDYIDLKTDITRSNLRLLLKFDLPELRKDEYQKMNESPKKKNEIKCVDIKEQYEDMLNMVKEKHEQEIRYLKNQLQDLDQQHISVSSTVQEVGSSGEFEINEVIQSYERRLQEQVTLAKLDIVAALELQIQRLAANEVDEEEWPSEFLRLRDKFTEKYEAQIKALNEEHQIEIEKLKEEHLKVLNGALERARKRSLRDSDSFNKNDIDILKERDNLKRQVSSLRNLLGELLKYFTQCEDELNNTLVDELIKQGFDKNISLIEEELNVTNSSQTSSSKTSDSTLNITRVHLTPNFTDLINIIENSSTEDGDSKDISMELKNELGVCLEKLKLEANALLTLTNNIGRQHVNEDNGDKNAILEEQLNSLKRKFITETQIKEDLKNELQETTKYVETLEREKDRLEAELETVIAKENALEEDLINTKNKIAQFLESGRKEVISEGYGEEGLHLQSMGDTVKILSDLQEKARSLLVQSRASADPTLLHLIEELCRVGERIKEESKRDRHDLLQQIEAADKKYRTSQTFLEEQAMEREQERDEAQKKIDNLYNQLKERDKDKVNCERISSEVDQLDQQLQEKNTALAAASQRIKEIETERNEAVEKIAILRDIIRDLEHQTESKSKEINQYLEAVKRLQFVVEQQEGISESSVVDSGRNVSDIGELYRHIDHLENELQKLRLQNELAGNEGPLKQIKTQLYEIESQVDKKTKELETLHSTASTNCSSPSEDVSAREVVLPKSPKKMEECEVPLQQLARLREKLIRHSRAEDAAMKRIRDLDMQVFSLKQDLEETTNEREYMKKQIQEQLVLISDLQIRLDEQRIRADNIEKQTNTSLELKIYDLQNEITTLGEKMQQKEKNNNNLQMLLVETQERLKDLEKELSYPKDDELVVSMQKQIDKLRGENSRMKTKIQNDANMVPNLVENIISDKNTDMERLRSKLDDTERLLEEYMSLKLDKKDLQTIASLKSNGTSLEELLGILDLTQADQMRRTEHSVSLNSPFNLPNKKVVEATLLEPELSAIAGPGVSDSPIQTRNSTEISHKKVHFEDTDVENLRKEIDNLKEMTEAKDKLLKDYEDRLKLLNNLEIKIERLQASLEETEKTLTTASETFEKEQKELKGRENDLGVQLAEKKLQLEKKEKEIEVLEQDSQRKDLVYKNLTKEKINLEKQLMTYGSELEKSRRLLTDKIAQITSMSKEKEKLLANLDSVQFENRQLQDSIKKSDNQIEELNNEIQELNNDILRLKKELDKKMIRIDTITGELTSFMAKLNQKRKIIRDLQETVASQKHTLKSLQEKQKVQKEQITDKTMAIEILNEDAGRYQEDISILQSELNEFKNSDISIMKKEVEEKELKISELNKQIAHLVELNNEKGKVINQMSEDSQKLHVNLVTIKSKLKEPGNLMDLGNKLRNERRKTAELTLEIHNLKAQLMHYKNNDMATSVDEIADQVKREIDHSIKIDSSILNAVSDQNLNSISETQDVEAYKKALSKEKSNKKQLLQHVHKLQAKITELQDNLEEERNTLLRIKTEDAQVIQQLRIKVDNCVINEGVLKKLFIDLNKEKEEVEKELNALKKNNLSSASKSESTEYKHLPSPEAIQLNQLRKDYEALQGEKNKMINELTAVNISKLELENSYKHTKDLLNLETQRKKNLEDRVKNLLAREKELKESLMQKNLEMERVVDELSQEKADLVKQKLELLQKIKSLNTTVPQVSSVPTRSVSDDLLDKIKQLNNALLDNKKLMDLITSISNEKKQLETELEIAKMGNENNEIPNQDIMARANYLFAKNLKHESVRKALIFQKRYLMEYLKSHGKQCLVVALPNPVSQKQFRIEYTLKHRFRVASLAIISIIRMKYLVKRWHGGVRMAEKINSRHYKITKKKIQVNPGPYAQFPVFTHFQVGQPVSNQFFSNLPTNVGPPRNPSNSFKYDCIEEERTSGEPCGRDRAAWSGNTPPSKEEMSRIKIGANAIKPEDMSPLRAPQLLGQYVERFDQIQERLGVILNPKSS